MKKLFIIMLLVVFCVSAAYAAVSTDRPTTVIHRTETEYNQEEALHRVVVGSAIYSTPELSFWYKFTEGPYIYWDIRLNPDDYTQEEIDYMDSIHVSHPNRHNIFVDLYDLTTETVETNTFTHGSWHGAKNQLPTVFPDFSETETEYVTITEQIDPYTILETTIEIVTTTDHVYQLIAWGCESPIILDLDNNDKVDVAKNRWKPHLPKVYNKYVRHFDMTGSGNNDFTEWIAPNPNDALLVKPENGKVVNALQLFGTAGGFDNGYEKLSIVCDTDKNGWVEGKELEGLMLWIDSNNNAICEKHELHTLESKGVKKISTQHKEFKSVYVTNDGQTRSTWDWWPSVMEVRKLRKR